MSWEGFYQALCEKGHEYQIDAYDYGNGKCPCGAECVFWNLVDQTNDDGAKDYLALVEKEPATLCTCEGCGSRHLLTRATFHIPEEGKGHRVEPGKFKQQSTIHMGKNFPSVSFLPSRLRSPAQSCLCALLLRGLKDASEFCSRAFRWGRAGRRSSAP